MNARSLVGLLSLVVVTTAVGCAPAIAEDRLGYFPPRHQDCAITVVNGAMQNPMLWAAPSSEYEMVGTITLHESSTADPFSEEHLKTIRPRACKMGGEALSLMSSTHSTNGFGFGTGTGTSFAVLRRRAGAAPGAAPTPTPKTMSQSL